MKTIFEGQPCNGLQAKGSRDRLLGDSLSAWLAVLYGSYYISQGDKDSSSSSDWSDLGSADSFERAYRGMNY